MSFLKNTVSSLKDTASGIANFGGMCRRTLGTMGLVALSAFTTLAPAASAFSKNKAADTDTEATVSGIDPTVLQSMPFARFKLPTDVVQQKRQSPTQPQAQISSVHLPDIVLQNKATPKSNTPAPIVRKDMGGMVMLSKKELKQRNIPKAEMPTGHQGSFDLNEHGRRYYMMYARYAPQGKEIPDGKNGHGGLHLGVSGYYDFLPRAPDALGIGASWDIMVNSPQTMGANYSASNAYGKYWASGSWTPSTVTGYVQSGVNLAGGKKDGGWIVEPYAKAGVHANPGWSYNLINYMNTFVGLGFQLGAHKDNGTGFLFEAEFGRRFYNQNYQYFQQNQKQNIFNYFGIKAGFTFGPKLWQAKPAQQNGTSYVDPATMQTDQQDVLKNWPSSVKEIVTPSVQTAQNLAAAPAMQDEKLRLEQLDVQNAPAQAPSKALIIG